MQPPVLVTAPTARVVELSDMKAHLRVDYDDEDTLITALEAAAVAHFDGWRGIMGRAIMPQTWSQEFSGWGRHKLLLPDASSVSAVGILDGVESPITETDIYVSTTMGGQFVTVSGGDADAVRITYEAALPAEQLPAVQMAVKLLVGHWYENREAATETALSAAPMAVQALIAPLRLVTV